MSKSVPIRLKPKQAIDAFVEAGEEPRASELLRAPASAGRSAPAPKPDKGEIVRITLDLPKATHRKLKMHVAGEGVTIAEFLRDLLDDRLG